VRKGGCSTKRESGKAPEVEEKIDHLATMRKENRLLVGGGRGECELQKATQKLHK